jgi:hypothetical protein
MLRGDDLLPIASDLQNVWAQFDQEIEQFLKKLST